MTLVALFVGLGFGLCLALVALTGPVYRQAYGRGVADAQARLADFIASMPSQDRDRYNELAMQHIVQQASKL